MQVSKWGNSLAVRLPASLVRALGLKEGDEVELVADKAGSPLTVRKKESLKEMIDRLQGSLGDLPEDYKFDREEANARGQDIS